MAENEIQNLITEVNTVARKYDLDYRKKGENFNIFEISSIQTDEVKICRLLKELIDPKGSHCQGPVYLKLFMEHVLQINNKFSDRDYENAWVEREAKIRGDRRIDLVINIESKRIPIEVKIYAGEQKNQCNDYLAEAKNANMYYLTLLAGQEPSDYSADKESKQKIKLISFEQEILTWLEQCLNHKETKNLMPISEVLRQFIKTIRRLTNQMPDEEKEKISKIISKSSQNCYAAKKIAQSLELAYSHKMEKIFKDLDCRILKILEMEERSENYAFDYTKTVKDYYTTNKTSFPGLSYCLKENIIGNLDLSFRIEIHDRLYWGYCIHKKNDRIREKPSSLEKSKFFFISKDFPHHEDNDFWLYWDYLPDSKETPNFRIFDDTSCDLFDDDLYKQFIEKCTKTIHEVLAMQKVLKNSNNSE